MKRTILIMALSVIAIIVLTFALGGYPPISATVVDAKTGDPIEGAVVLVEWTNTHGFGHTHTESYKVVEIISNKEGRVNIEGVYRPFLNKPHVTVYKKGYVAWNDEYIFPGNKRRQGFKWENNLVIKMEQFSKKDFSHNHHVSFLRTATRITLDNDIKNSFEKLFEWEVDLAREEVFNQIN